MDQEKIGKFIQKLRKDNHMTQQELADKLNVTDRAISHWENGRRLPDVSLYKPICEIFNISVNELISGEKIDKDTITKKSEENIINTLNINKENQKKSKIIISILFLIIIIIIITPIAYYKKMYPKFDIYTITISKSNINDSVKEYKIKDNIKVYYYELDELLLCDIKECYKMKDALKRNQTTIEKIKSFLESQTELKNIKKLNLWDGGTKIYSNLMYSIIVCNTLDGNNDIYIGPSDMISKLNNGYCGHAESTTKKFTRTYYIVSITDDDDENYINVTLKTYQGPTEIVKLDKSANITAGRNYEFTFINYHEFEDTISNIFEYSQVVEIKETKKVGMDQINEAIYTNNEN